MHNFHPYFYNIEFEQVQIQSSETLINEDEFIVFKLYIIYD